MTTGGALSVDGRKQLYSYVIDSSTNHTKQYDLWLMHPRYVVDSLIEQLIQQLGHVRIVRAGEPISVLDQRYVGTLKQVLIEHIPGIAAELLASLEDDSIVLQQADAVNRGEPVGLERSTLRVAGKADIGKLQVEFAEELNVLIRQGKHLDTDWKAPILTFSEGWFAPRTIRGWAELSLYFARLCARMEELKVRTRLKERDIFYDDRDGHRIPTRLVDADGNLLETD